MYVNMYISLSLILHVLCISIMASNLVFLWDSWVVNEWVSVSIYVSCAFGGTLFLLFVLSYSDVLVFVLYYYVLLLFHRYLFVFKWKTERGWIDLDERGGGEELRGVEGEATNIWIHCKENIYVQYKGK